jgi:hypothetical protein
MNKHCTSLEVKLVQSQHELHVLTQCVSDQQDELIRLKTQKNRSEELNELQESNFKEMEANIKRMQQRFEKNEIVYEKRNSIPQAKDYHLESVVADLHDMKRQLRSNVSQIEEMRGPLLNEYRNLKEENQTIAQELARQSVSHISRLTLINGCIDDFSRSLR